MTVNKAVARMRASVGAVRDCLDLPKTPPQSIKLEFSRHSR